ncbi:CvpA family protein [Treponema sp. HNW]|uniref:CvpA family protein n=1 Tax=Treponema sp. HNW TaxID=3116654 RepID=UPI003D0C5A7E
MTFNFLDIVFIVIILFIAIHGAVNGFIKELFGKASLVLGVLAAVMFYAKLMPYINRHIKSAFVSQILAFLLIFVFVYLIVRLVQHFVGTFFSGDILQGLDRALGFFFGAAEGLLLIFLVLVILYAQPWFKIGSLVDTSFFHTVLEKFLAKPVSRVQDFIAASPFFAGEMPIPFRLWDKVLGGFHV